MTWLDVQSDLDLGWRRADRIEEDSPEGGEAFFTGQGHVSAKVSVVRDEVTVADLASDTARPLALGCEFDALHGSGHLVRVGESAGQRCFASWPRRLADRHRTTSDGTGRKALGRRDAGEHGCDGMIRDTCRRVSCLGGHDGKVHGLPEIAGLLFGKVGCWRAHAPSNRTGIRRIPGGPN
jgi:hypothetical protein